MAQFHLSPRSAAGSRVGEIDLAHAAHAEAVDDGLAVDRLEMPAPIGLLIGGRSPQEIALSIMAQIVATRNERDSMTRRQASGP